MIFNGRKYDLEPTFQVYRNSHRIGTVTAADAMRAQQKAARLYGRDAYVKDFDRIEATAITR